MHVPSLLAVSVVLLLGSSVAADEPYEIEVHEEIAYGIGGDQRLYLDIAVPVGADGLRPAVLYIHGGGWAGGKRQDLGGEIRRMAARGYVAATITYRLAPKSLFPAAVEDAKTAVRYLRANVGEWNIDPERIGAVGFSAGAHLAMMLGVMQNGDGLDGDSWNSAWEGQDASVNAVVSYVGPTNLLSDYPPVSQQIVANFIGGAKDEKRDAYERASPVTYVDQRDAPMLLFAGTRDQLVPWDQAVQMAQALTEAGIPGRIELCLGQDHGLNSPEIDHAAEIERTREATDEFLDHYLNLR